MTQPRHDSQAQASKQRLRLDFIAPDDLICPAQDLFDAQDIEARLAAAIGDETDAGKIRALVVSDLLATRKTGMACIASAFRAAPFDARAMTRAYTYLTDCLVRTCFAVATQVLHPLSTPTEQEKLSVLAVGGYGRGEMAPQSDVDLLFLTPYKVTPWAESVIESMLYMLWDLRLKVGQSSRTIRDCIRLGREDFTIRTAMLEQRFLTGDAALAETLERQLWDEVFSGTSAEFIEAKLGERDARHIKQGQRYVVEPNVKEGKGGLRDLQSLFWIAKYVHGVQDAADLVAVGVFTDDEFSTFEAAEDFLWAVRGHLHLIAGRPMEQLTFDLQVEVAQQMGYCDTPDRRAVEVFMQAYFRHATAVGDLTRIFLTKLEAIHAKPAPLLERIFRRKPRVKAGYKVVHNRLAIEDDDVFLTDPLNLLRIYEEALRTGMLIHPDAMRAISANLDLIDEGFRKTPEAQRIFLDLMLKHGDPERALRRMNELGVLSAFIPEFEPIVAMMQFNMYHHYTVDEHTIQCIHNLAEIERGALEDDLPISTEILTRGLNRKVLYVAMLLHDIGKGRQEDHSILGAKIARKVAPRLGLSQAETDTVEWLVRYHLLMSDMAQKRDIADPRTVRDFAKAVRDVKRLDLLTVLTVCDIRGVGPDTWNNWKAVLIRALYRQTRNALENGLEDLNREQRGTDAKRALREALSDWPAKDLRIETARHYPPYWQGLHVTAHVVFAKLLRTLGDDEIALDVHADEDRDATRVCFANADHPGIFSRLTGALALVGANIVDARTFTSNDGYATAAFWVQDNDGSPYEASRLPRLKSMIERTLGGEVVASKAMADRDKLKKRERAFKVPTHITFDNDGSEIYTIIEVDTRDRRDFARFDPNACVLQRIYRLSSHRDLWRASRRYLLRQGHVRIEILHTKQTKARLKSTCARHRQRCQARARRITRNAAAVRHIHSWRLDAAQPCCGLCPRCVDPELSGHRTSLSGLCGGLSPAEHVPAFFCGRRVQHRLCAHVLQRLEAANGADGFAREAFSGLASILIVLTLAAQLTMPWLIYGLASGFAGTETFDLSVEFGRIAFPYILFISLAALASGVLNASGRFAAAAARTSLAQYLADQCHAGRCVAGG